MTSNEGMVTPDFSMRRYLSTDSTFSIVYDDLAGDSVLKMVYGNTSNPNMNLIRHLEQDVDRVHIRYEMRFSNNWQIAKQNNNSYQKFLRAWKKVEEVTDAEYNANAFSKWASETDKHAAFGSSKSYNVNGTFLPAWNCTHMWKDELGNTVGDAQHRASYFPYADGDGYLDQVLGRIGPDGRLMDDQQYHTYEWWFDYPAQRWGLDVDGVAIPEATKQEPKYFDDLPLSEAAESSASVTNKLFTDGGIGYNLIKCFDNSSNQEYGEAGAMFVKSIVIADGPIGTEYKV